ncbi:MAG: hypothetical protein KAU62_10065 [Candidatus Heimdallarchaeota archaeon]|nr:hypothetical protein [Candidatus Heimdallarchaeota archaeon]MCG3256422.1 hypothetical protein [Candidatus Heimdallarchaeota archaeon]MCK4611488.1 hypothetical protein [Candidatus Heimdallarchaeota archaeon]
MINERTCGLTCGRINSLTGGFILVIQGLLTIIAEAKAARGLEVVGGMSFLSFTGIYWLNGLIMFLLGILVLFLVWDWLQKKMKTGPWIKDITIIAVMLIIIGFITGGAGGLFILSGGIWSLVGQTKTTQTSTV